MPSLELTPENAAALKQVREFFDCAEKVHKGHRDRWNEYYRLYRSYKSTRKSYSVAQSTGDTQTVKDVLQDARRSVFGPDLFIPYTFATIETLLPKILAHNPRMLVTPADPKWERNTQNVRLMIDRQQTRTDYPLVLQDVGKSGLIYGLGVQSLGWEKQTQSSYVLQKNIAAKAGEPTYVQTATDKVIYEGAKAQAVDVFDWLWEPSAHSIDTLSCCIRRVWMGPAEVRERFDSKTWTLPAGYELEDALALGSAQARDDVWADRMAAAGRTQPDRRGEHVHEVWEYHDGGEVIVILDREIPVLAGENPYWHGEIPFQVYRPTKVMHEMVGIGEPEATQDLQVEMNEGRTNRRDNARLILQRPYFYWNGLVDPTQFVFGPGAFNPVDADPSSVLYSPPMQEIPNSSYQEDAALQRDIERVTGIDDTQSGNVEAAATATGVQLAQAAANVRVANKAMLAEIELMKPGARQWLALNQQKIVDTKFVPGPPQPGDMAHTSWSWYEIGPEELAGEFELEPEAGASQAQNPVERQARGRELMQVFGQDPYINPQELRRRSLELYGIDTPDALLAPQTSISISVVEKVKQALAESGAVDPNLFDQLLQGAEIEQQQMEQQQGAAQGPGPGQDQGQGAPAPPAQQPMAPTG